MKSLIFETPGSVKNLRRYWKNRKILPDPVQLVMDLSKESDRSLIILCATILDDMLTNLIARNIALNMEDKEYDTIFRFEGPLGSFSSRIEIAYLFNLIDDISRSQLNDIREMRNACAHSKRTMTFATKELESVAKRLIRYPYFHPKPTNTRDGLRLAVLAEFNVEFSVLTNGPRDNALDSLRKAKESLRASFSP
jgi:hypothetical protein